MLSNKIKESGANQPLVLGDRQSVSMASRWGVNDMLRLSRETVSALITLELQVGNSVRFLALLYSNRFLVTAIANIN
jgi:hypothetical protein